MANLRESYVQQQPQSQDDYNAAAGIDEVDKYFLKDLNKVTDELHRLMRKNNGKFKELASKIIWGKQKNGWLDNVLIKK